MLSGSLTEAHTILYSSSGYRRLQRNIEIGRQWTKVNDIPDGRTVYADVSGQFFYN